MAKDPEEVRSELVNVIQQLAATAPTLLTTHPAEFALGVAQIAFMKGVNEGLQQASDRIAASLSR